MQDYTKDGTFTPGKVGEWRFDKRTYSQVPPPRNLGEPPPGMKNNLVRSPLHAFPGTPRATTSMHSKFSATCPEAHYPALQVRHLIHAINDASAAIPGWDEYARTGVATEFWDGK